MTGNEPHTQDEELDLEQFRVLQLGHRTSVWVRQGDRWLLRLHQGTPFNAEAAPVAEQ